MAACELRSELGERWIARLEQRHDLWGTDHEGFATVCVVRHR